MDDRFKTLEKYNLWGRNDFPTGYKRQDYLDRILSYTGNRLIKVLVGQRRVGKSYLLRQLASHLANNGVNPRNIFFINSELSAFYFLKTSEDLDSLFNLYLKQINPQGRIYLFIDEIQNVEGWERFANSYSQDYTAEYELFISGSNSKMLSGELATLLAGRYVEFAIYHFIESSSDRYIKNKELSSSLNSFHSNLVGMTGFEPATTRPPDEYSNRTELHPVCGCKSRNCF